MTKTSNVIPFPTEKTVEQTGDKDKDKRGIPETVRLAIAVRAMEKKLGICETYRRLTKIIKQLEDEM